MAIEPTGGAAFTGLPAIDLGSRHVWPTLIGMHAHLDKGHIVTRTENPDGSFAGALQSTIEDRTQRWTARGCQTAHGIRTSLMSTVSLRSAQLIDAETDARAWAERFDRDTHLKPPISLVWQG
jgi:cytosine/adenosine deaminase-related metal-dependent hydrolase